MHRPHRMRPHSTWGMDKYNKGGAEREAKRRGDMIEKYLPYAASYTAAMSAANATPCENFQISCNEQGHLRRRC